MFSDCVTKDCTCWKSAALSEAKAKINSCDLSSDNKAMAKFKVV